MKEGEEEVYFTADVSLGTFDAPAVSVPDYPEKTVGGC